jgi:hypothetical protein
MGTVTLGGFELMDATPIEELIFAKQINKLSLEKFYFHDRCWWSNWAAPSLKELTLEDCKEPADGKLCCTLFYLACRYPCLEKLKVHFQDPTRMVDHTHAVLGLIIQNVLQDFQTYFVLHTPSIVHALGQTNTLRRFWCESNRDWEAETMRGLIDLLQSGQNYTLSDFSCLSAFFGQGDERNYPFEGHACADSTQNRRACFLLDFNWFGRLKLTDLGTTIDQFVELLSNAPQ